VFPSPSSLVVTDLDRGERAFERAIFTSIVRASTGVVDRVAVRVGVVSRSIARSLDRGVTTETERAIESNRSTRVRSMDVPRGRRRCVNDEDKKRTDRPESRRRGVRPRPRDDATDVPFGDGSIGRAVGRARGRSVAVGPFRMSVHLTHARWTMDDERS